MSGSKTTVNKLCIALFFAVGGASYASDGSLSKNPDALKNVERAARAAENGDSAESFKFYQRAVQADSSPSMRRHFGELYFNMAERIKEKYLAEHHASFAALQTAEDGAKKEVTTGMFGKYKKFNPDDPTYKAMLKRYQETLKNISECVPYYDKAEENYSGLLRAAPGGKDFDSAAHQALCLTIKNETHTKVRARQMLVAVVNTYKPANDAEKALFERCQQELETMEK